MSGPVKYADIVKTLLERVPSFRNSELARQALSDLDYELDYVVFGTFASFLNDRIPELSTANPEIRTSFQLLNDMANSGDPRLEELAAIGVFEVLTDSPHSIRAARELLYGRAIDLFEEMIQNWGIEVRDRKRWIWTDEARGRSSRPRPREPFAARGGIVDRATGRTRYRT
jgi:hypothetical protein